jgi:hypothetical protein
VLCLIFPNGKREKGKSSIFAAEIHGHNGLCCFELWVLVAALSGGIPGRVFFMYKKSIRLCNWGYLSTFAAEKFQKIMSEQELNKILSDAIALPAETEIVEFKEAKNSYDFDKIGKYFSALIPSI